MSLVPLWGRSQAIPIKQASRANVRARDGQARMGPPSQRLMGCNRRGFRTLEGGQSWSLTVQAS